MSVNGTGSSDPDGSINGYSWNWGGWAPCVDGFDRIARLRTAGRNGHVDRDGQRLGATDTESVQVTVAAAQQVALDTFTRTAGQRLRDGQRRRHLDGHPACIALGGRQRRPGLGTPGTGP